MPRCPECGGKMIYRKDLKVWVCTSCGLMLTREQLDEIRERILYESKKEEKKSKVREYLDWWMGKEE